LTVCGDYEEDVVSFYGAVFQWWKIDRLLKEDNTGLLGNQSISFKQNWLNIF